MGKLLSAISRDLISDVDDTGRNSTPGEVTSRYFAGPDLRQRLQERQEERRHRVTIRYFAGPDLRLGAEEETAPAEESYYPLFRGT